MSFIVAGGVLLLALITGAVSYIVVPYFEEEIDENGNEIHKKSNISPAATLAELFAKKNCGQLCFVLMLALICAVAAFVYCREETGIFNICRRMLTALVLLSATVIDKKTHLIPNVLVLITLGVGAVLLVLEFIFCREEFLFSLIASFAGMICCLVLFYLMARLTKDGIGMGDVKLISVMGWMIGLSQTIMTVFFALLMCTLLSVLLLIIRKKTKNDRMAFGPFVFFGYILLLILIGL